MVKSNQPLQIRLTEPVVFLRGPSTGLDFRGRPIGVDANAAPAMLRGLLTLRLSKPTRIRSIVVKLDGRSRTEWPEGIGPRRLDTYEEHQIILESTTFFDVRQRQSRSRSARRAASIGPGVYAPPSELSSEDVDEDLELVDVPGEGEDQGTAHRGRERERGFPRSASALPGGHDGNTWHRDGFSRRPSYDTSDDQSRPASNDFITMRDLTLRDADRARGPSPAYTPVAERFPIPANGSTGAEAGRAFRENVLSPIQSAGPSRAASDREESTETQARKRAERSLSPLAPGQVAEDDEEGDSPGVAEGTDSGGANEDHHDTIRSILANGQVSRERAGTNGEVRFVDPAQAASVAPALPDTAPNGVTDTIGEDGVYGETSDDEDDHDVGPSRSTTTQTDYHPNNAAIHAISASSTAHNSPAPSRPASYRPRTSTDDDRSPPQPSSALALSPLSETAPAAASIPAESSRQPQLHTGPSASASASSSRRSSFRQHPSVGSRSSAQASAASSTSSLSEVRQGRKNRLGSHSTIVINHDPSVPPVPTPTMANGSGSRTSPPIPNGSASRPGPGPGARSSIGGSDPSSAARPALPPSEDTGRRGSRFSLAATIRGISQDVKDRVRQSSKSRTRQPSVSRNGINTDIPIPPIPPTHRASLGASESSTSRSRSTTRNFSSSFIPPRADLSPVSARRSIRTPSFSNPDPNFVRPGGGRGGQRVSQSRERGSVERTGSPAPERNGARTLADVEEKQQRSGRSPSRGRGRNKGMKVLTDALGLGDNKVDEQDGEEDVHNWKEFRKGTYNYPISFPIPVATPPTVHAEFGSVSYRLKATVVRVGALTPNMTEEVEVVMIATPQEDDLEESENVIVERQWEDQMRYQITLSGKAFPIGGIIPLSVRIMPLMKCKIHRLSCVLEEKTDYFAQGRKVVRHESPRKFTLLFIKQVDRAAKDQIEPLLPIISDNPDAARQSPLAALARAAALNNPTLFTNFAGEQDDDALYAGLMDPFGPWHLEQELQIPDCAARMRFTTKHEKTSISVSHWLKVTIRVERGDDVALDSKGKRKQFDIIIETPVKLLDCRVNPQYNSLPTYSSYSPSSTAALSGLCSIHGTKSTAASASQANPPVPTRLSTQTSRIEGFPRQSSISASGSVSAGGPSSSPATASTVSRRREDGDDTLLERNIVFDRLMSGQETEEGDVPPSYGEALSSAGEVENRPGRSGGRSSSATGRGGRGSMSPAVVGGRLGRVMDDRAESQSRSRSRLREGG